MKLVILAAGYGTRLYPLTLDRPKALLPVAGRPMLEHLLGCLGSIEEIEATYIVTNSKFARHFHDWAATYRPPRNGHLEIVDDGTTSNDDRLGAIGDLDLVVRTRGIEDDVIVAAGDNLFSEDLGDFGRFGLEKNAPVLAVYDVGSLEEMKKYSSIVVDDEGRITFFEEKPERPSSTLAGIALYFYPRGVLPEIRRYLAEGKNADQPGRLVEWLYVRVPFYTWRVLGTWYDIGSEQTLREADRAFGIEAGR